MRIRYLILFFLLLISDLMFGQLDRYGSPVSWTLGPEIEENSYWNVMSSPDVNSLLAEDELTADDHAIPFRFAFARSVEWNTSNSGRWSNLRNGDRIWMLGIECTGAFSVGLTLSAIAIPRGSRLYVYAEDRSDYIGPIQNHDVTPSDTVCLPHIRGSRIIIEYYEPYASRGQSYIELGRVAHAYKDLRINEFIGAESCIQMNSLRSEGNNLVNVSSSVMAMLVDYGQRVATATMLNNSSVDATPYALTAESALIGPPSSWCFQYNLIQDYCHGFQDGCGLNTICGAGVVKSDRGISLLRLSDSPLNNWAAYYSGFRINPEQDSSSFTSIQHAFGLPQSVVSYSGRFGVSAHHGEPTMTLSAAAEGQASQGSAGSPLFDRDLNLLGIYVGGNLHCDNNGFDHFAMLTDSWPALKGYLDPFEIVEDRVEGYYPRMIEEEYSYNELNISFFPNPATNWIYIQNNSDLPLIEVLIHNAAGILVDRFRPMVPSVTMDHLPEGLYFITFVAGTERRTQKLLLR